MSSQYVNTSSHHDVRVYVRAKIDAGSFKGCSHLRVQPMKRVEDERVFHFFIPQCRLASFQSKYSGIDEQGQFNILVHHLAEDTLSCPTNCLNYENVKWLKVRVRAKRYWAHVLRPVSVPFRWFEKLPSGTQVAIIVAVCVLGVLKLAPQWVPLISQLLSAYHGK